MLSLLLVGAGAGAALARTQSSASPSSTGTAAAGTAAASEAASWRNRFLDDLARRLGISRSRLDAALESTALADVAFAEHNGLISKTEANLARRAIRSGVGPAVQGHLGFGVGLGGFPMPGPLPVGGPFLNPSPLARGFPGPFVRREDPLADAAPYLGLTPARLMADLRSETLAQVAQQQGKPVSGLEAAMRRGAQRGLDRWVKAGVITPGQESALMGRFSSDVGALVNGIPPSVAKLAGRLGIEPASVVSAIEGAAIDQVQAARRRGLLTRSEAAFITRRIRTGAGLPLGGVGIAGGIGPRPGLPLPRRGLGWRRSPSGDGDWDDVG
jgi:hypothetical protein